ncbi:hypothetical protein MRS44_006064 [Fusarium solani]|nr:hypothetical protein MRS44_006064 [Fusarium solani]
MENLSLIERVEEELAASYEDRFVHEFLRGKVKDDHHPPLLVQAKINEMRRKNTSLATNIERLSKQNDALEKDLETAHRESETLRDSETALWQLKNRTEFEQGLNKLEAILNSVEKDMVELIAQGELGLAAEQELEQQLIMEREEHHAEKREYRREHRKERARNSALVERVKALELLEVEDEGRDGG